MKKEFTIPAECHSDDHAVECPLDAAPWFKRATTREIVALAKCDWGGDYPADQVALNMAGRDEDVRFMFRYIEVRKKLGQDIGFECNVQETEARAWLKKNRPRVYSELPTD